MIPNPPRFTPDWMFASGIAPHAGETTVASVATIMDSIVDRANAFQVSRTMSFLQRSGRDRLKCPVQVVNQIGRVLDSERQPHQRIGDPLSRTLLGLQKTMGRHRGLGDQGFDAPEAGRQIGDLERFYEARRLLPR